MNRRDAKNAKKMIIGLKSNPRTNLIPALLTFNWFIVKFNCRCVIPPETKVSGCQTNKSAKETTSRTPKSQSQGVLVLSSPMTLVWGNTFNF